VAATFYNETGYLYVYFYSDDYTYLPDNNVAFTSEGTFTRVYKQSAVGKNYIYSVSDSIKCSNLTGEGYIYYLNGVYLETYTDLTGSANAKGSGKLVD